MKGFLRLVLIGGIAAWLIFMGGWSKVSLAFQQLFGNGEQKTTSKQAQGVIDALSRHEDLSKQVNGTE